MRIELNIQNSHVLIILLFITAASAIGLAAAYGGDSPSTVGHSWGEMECSGCIINSNLAGNSVNSAKIQDETITGADILNGSITNADIISLNGSKVTGKVPNATYADTAGNANTVDGRHALSWMTLITSCGATSYIDCPSGWTSYGTYIIDCSVPGYGLGYYVRVCYKTY